MAFLTTVTLLMRPVGALVFGLWADRVGRRIPLMVDVVYYSIVGFLCAFAPNFTVLLDVAAALRHRDGRRVGAGSCAGDGEDPERAAWLFLRSAAGRLFDRLPVRDLAYLVVVNWLGLSWRWLFAL